MNKEKENKNAEISARIAEILQYTGDTRNGFAVKLGYERAQTVYDVMNMKSAPSYDFFRRFSISEYSDIIDLKWLLSGEGPMLRTDDTLATLSTHATDTSVSSDAVVLRLMDKLDEKDTLLKEKDAENKHLQSELRAMTAELASLKAQDKEPERHSDMDKATETFTDESSRNYGKGYSPTKPLSTSKKSLVGKT